MSEYDVEDELDEDEEDFDAFQKRFDVLDEESAEFDRIPVAEKLHPNRDICAILKVYSLLKDEEKRKFYMGAEHDIIYLADEGDLVELTDADVLYLVRCGVFYDEETSSLAFFA